MSNDLKTNSLLTNEFRFKRPFPLHIKCIYVYKDHKLYIYIYVHTYRIDAFCKIDVLYKIQLEKTT